MRNAYAMNNYTEAKAALEKIFRQLERINPTAARSLEEGLEETLTVHRLGIERCCDGNSRPPTRSNRVCQRCSVWHET
jgi:plasmid stabilization system protein ParE